MAVKKMWNVMGAHPGDGSTQSAETPEEALLQHVIQEFDNVPGEPTAAEVAKVLDDFRKAKTVCENGKRFNIGDYEVIELSQ